MQKRILFWFRWIFPVMIVFILLLGVLTEAQAAPFFKGKVIKVVVPYAPGGGTDVFTRLVVTHLKRHIPGKPSMVVRNMPGGGSLIGGNYAWHQRPDGKTVLVTSGTSIATNIYRTPGIEYYLEKTHPLYSTPIGSLCYAWSDVGLKKPADIMKAKGDQLIFGHIGPTGGTGGFVAWAKALLNFEAKMIWGYGGSGDARLAFYSRESTMGGEATNSFNATMLQYLKKGEIVPLVQSGIFDDDGNIVREPAAPDMPTAPELYEKHYGKKPSGPIWEAYKLIVGTRTYGKCFTLLPKTPAKVVKIYRKAVADMIKDPKFLKDSKRLTPGAPHYHGKGLARTFPSAVSGPPEIVNFMKKYYKDTYNIEM